MAHQPVFDTLQVADEMEQRGMEREQATGLAHVLGNQLGEHVAVRKDLDLGFEDVRAEVTVARTELDAKIEGVRAEITGVRAEVTGARAELNAKIDGTRAELNAKIDGVNGKLNFGFALMIALLSVLIGIGLFNGAKGATAPPRTVEAPPAAAAPGGAPQPTPGAAAPVRDGATTSVESVSVSPAPVGGPTR